MSSAYVTRTVRSGMVRYRVRYRLGGRETSTLHGGSFATMREARLRRDWIAGELAAGRVPRLGLETALILTTVATVAEQWRISRLDVADGTAQAHRVNLNRILPKLGTCPVAEVEPSDVAAFVAGLHEAGLKREPIRKTLVTLRMVLDFAGRKHDNPARDSDVRSPRRVRVEFNPPTSEHVEAVYRLLPARYRVPLLVLDATGMRVGELEGLKWGDVDEPKRRWRVTAALSKTGAARWVSVPELLFGAVLELLPRDDRTAERRVFEGFGSDRFRRAIARATTAAGVPAFSPHDLRHRRVSLMHEQGVSWARIGEQVGHGDIATTARTYTHVMVDGELDYTEMLKS